jgi:D-lyxose ketol-isomerase
MDKTQAVELTLKMFESANIVLSDEEKKRIEVADMGLNNLEVEGLQLITYVNNERYCAKDLVLFPNQTCPEHRHPPLNNKPGKQETFRCRYGTVYLYVEGEPTSDIKAKIPSGKEAYYTARKEIILRPGEQFTIPPNTLHWFQAGSEGAIISEFSSTSYDEFDIFTDPNVIRVKK